MISTIILSIGGILSGFVIGCLLYRMFVWLNREVDWLLSFYVLALIFLAAGGVLLASGL